MIAPQKALTRKVNFAHRRLKDAYLKSINLINQINYGKIDICARKLLHATRDYLIFSRDKLLEKIYESAVALSFEVLSDTFATSLLFSKTEKLKSLTIKSEIILPLLTKFATKYGICGHIDRISFAKEIREKRKLKKSAESALCLLMDPIENKCVAPIIELSSYAPEIVCAPIIDDHEKTIESAIDLLMDPNPEMDDTPCLTPAPNFVKRDNEKMDAKTGRKEEEWDCHVEYRGSRIFTSPGYANLTGIDGEQWISGNILGLFLRGFLVSWHPMPWYLRWKWKV